MSSQQIDELIGQGFQPLRSGVSLSVTSKPRTAPPRFYRSPFLSGPKSRFISEPPDLGLSLGQEMRLIHEQAQEQRRLKQQATLINVIPTKTEQRRFLSGIDRTTRDLRNFIVSEVAVFELSLSTAMQEARDMLEQLTGSKVEGMQMKRVQRSAELLMDLHMVNKISQVMGVSREVRKSVLDQLGAVDGQTPSPGAKTKSILPELLRLSQLQAAGKESHGQVRGVDQARPPQSQRRVDGQLGAPDSGRARIRQTNAS